MKTVPRILFPAMLACLTGGCQVPATMRTRDTLTPAFEQACCQVLEDGGRANCERALRALAAVPSDPATLQSQVICLYGCNGGSSRLILSYLEALPDVRPEAWVQLAAQLSVLTDTRDLDNAHDFGIPPENIVQILPEQLKARGYATGMIGKWHVGFHEDRDIRSGTLKEIRNGKPIKALDGTPIPKHNVVDLVTNPTELAGEKALQSPEKKAMLSKKLDTVYKELPTGARALAMPAVPFKEELVVDGRFPESDAGKKLFKEFSDHTKASGKDELMHSAVFKGTDTTKEKRVRDYLRKEKD